MTDHEGEKDTKRKKVYFKENENYKWLELVWLLLLLHLSSRIDKSRVCFLGPAACYSFVKEKQERNGGRKKNN